MGAARVLAHNSCGDLHHTIPRAIRKPRSGKPGKLRKDVAEHPDVVGRRGKPNRWRIPRKKHKEIHKGKGSGGDFNRRWEAELDKLPGEAEVEDVLRIRDALVKEFGLDGYRPW